MIPWATGAEIEIAGPPQSLDFADTVLFADTAEDRPRAPMERGFCREISGIQIYMVKKELRSGIPYET